MQKKWLVMSKHHFHVESQREKMRAYLYKAYGTDNKANIDNSIAMLDMCENASKVDLCIHDETGIAILYYIEGR